MVGFISLLSLIAIIFGGVWSLVANFVENIEKEDIKIIQKNAFKRHTQGLLLTLFGLTLDIIVIVDSQLWDNIFLIPRSISECLEPVYSPIFHADYLNGVWIITMVGIWIGVGLGSLILFLQFINSFRIKGCVVKQVNQFQKEQEQKLALKQQIEMQNITEEKEILSQIEKYDKVTFIDGNEETGYKGWKNAFYVNVESQTIIASGRLIAFKDILSCSCSDNSQVLYNQTAHSTTTTDSGNMVGRAIVGGVIAGDAGAIIGGSTAQKNTTTNIQTKSTTIHDYAIIITTKDIINPTCEIHCGENEKAMNDIVGTINAIISHN